MILRARVPLRSSDIYNPATQGDKCITCKQLCPTVGLSVQQLPWICLLSRGSRVRVWTGVPQQSLDATVDDFLDVVAYATYRRPNDRAPGFAPSELCDG